MHPVFNPYSTPMLSLNDLVHTLRRCFPDREVRQTPEGVRISDDDHTVLIIVSGGEASIHYDHDPTDPTVIEDPDPHTMVTFLRGAFKALDTLAQTPEQ